MALTAILVIDGTLVRRLDGLAAKAPTLAVLTGGFSAAELREAGAAEVVESIRELRSAGAGDSPLQLFLRHL